MNPKRVERLWRQEGLKVPSRQPKRRRLWLHDGCCVRLRPTHRNHVWSYDFVSGRTHDGRTLRLLTLLDEYTRECLAIRGERRIGSPEVIETLSDVMVWQGVPEHIRSDNGPEFLARDLRQWLGKVGTGTLYIEPGSPWDNEYYESFNGKLRDECLNGEPEFPISNPDRPVPTPRCCLSQLDPSLPDLSIPFQVPETLIGALSTIENHATPPGRRAFPAGHLEGTEHSPFCPRVDCAESG